MRKDKTQAIYLRQQGKSYNEISKKLSAPKSTLAAWFGNITIPKTIQTEILTKAQKVWARNITVYNKKRGKEARKKWVTDQEEAVKDINKLSLYELRLVGTALYWAEGYKKTNWEVMFCNSEPKLISLMMKFFRKVCKIPENKFRPQVQIHQNIKEEEAKDYWSKITDIPTVNFRKSLYQIPKSSKQKRFKNTLPYGTFRISIYDVKLVNRIKGWIKGLSQ